MQKRNFILNENNKKPIFVDIRFVSSTKSKPMVIFCHGFKGFKDWGHFNLIADYFANAGFVFVKFSFSHNGTTADHLCDFDDLKAFGLNNFSIELQDAKLVLDYIYNNANQFEGDKNNITIIGHSRGGGIAILMANLDSRIQKLITWASVCDFNYFFSNIDLNKWKSNGIVNIYNARTKQEMPLYYQFYEDYLRNKELLNIQNAAENLSKPWLILHGSNDQAVSVDAALQLHEWNLNSTLEIINDADHTFGGKHPYDTTLLPEHTEHLLKTSILFLDNN